MPREKTMSYIVYILTFISILGCGLVAGIFFAFSTFVMQALGSLLPAQGVEAMQKINVTVLNRWFLGVFMGTAVICLLLALSTIWRWDQPGSFFLLVGCLLYLIGTFLVTVIFNVPKNNTLKDMVSSSGEAEDYWNNTYLTKWTFWNHVRTGSALLGMVSLVISL